MKKAFLAVVLMLAVATMATASFFLPESIDREAWALTVAYLRYNLMSEMVRQATGMAGEDEALAEEISDFLNTWSSGQKTRIKSQLTNVFGDDSREAFESFVSELSQAQNDGDAEYLADLADALVLDDPPPGDFSELLSRAADQYIASDLKAMGDRLGEIQTWVELKQSEEEVPPLSIWMAQFVHVQKAPVIEAEEIEEPPPPPEPKPMTEMERLAAMEMPLGQVQGKPQETENPMDAFSTTQKERRARVVEEAHAQMEQIAAERAAAEERYASRKLAAAQADAEAMKQMAEQFAAVEKEALEQRKNSWGNRLKRIVGSVVSATTGAFTGSIGTRAGQEAANALFE